MWIMMQLIWKKINHLYRPLHVGNKKFLQGNGLQGLRGAYLCTNQAVEVAIIGMIIHAWLHHPGQSILQE